MAQKTETKTTETLEQKLWKSADKLRKNIDASEYKHIALGLIFLKQDLPNHTICRGSAPVPAPILRP